LILDTGFSIQRGWKGSSSTQLFEVFDIEECAIAAGEVVGRYSVCRGGTL